MKSPAVDICWDMSVAVENGQPVHTSFTTNLEGVNPVKVVIVYDRYHYAYVVDSMTATWLKGKVEDTKRFDGVDQTVQYWTLGFFMSNIFRLNKDRVSFMLTDDKKSIRYKAMFDKW